MTLFLIRRALTGATREHVDAAGYRAVACAFNFPGLQWVSSYWDEGREEIHCVYYADSAEQIEDHSRRARIPCDEIRPVVEIGPHLYRDGDSTAAAGNLTGTDVVAP